MNKNYFKAEKLLNAPNTFFVKFKNGLKILLLTVATGAAATPVYDYSVADTNAPSSICLSKTGLNIQLEYNIGVKENALYDSLMLHRGENLPATEMEYFWKVARQVSDIEFKDSMVCYDEEDHEISYDLLTSSDTIVHLTQYFEEPTDQIVFSIEKDGIFLHAGHLPIDGFSPYLLEIIKKIEQKS